MFSPRRRRLEDGLLHRAAAPEFPAIARDYKIIVARPSERLFTLDRAVNFCEAISSQI